MPIRSFLLLAAISAAVLGAAPIRAQTITMGDAAIETTGDGGAGNKVVANSATLSQPAQLKSISFYGLPGYIVGNLRLGVYDASGPNGQPGKLLARTGSFKVVAGWNTHATTTSPLLAAGAYWLAFQPTSSNLGFVEQRVSGVCLFYDRAFSSGFAATFPTSGLGNCSPTTLSLYAALTASGPPPLPKPTVVSFTPASPSLPDTTTSGMLISAISVTTSDGSKFNGSLSLTANPASTATVVGGNLDLARNLSTADDGSIPFTVQATENGGTASGNVTLTVTASPAPTLTITVTPSAPSISNTAPLGSTVANAVAAWSNGSQFTGTLGFVAPYNDDGGTFALSCTQCASANVIISPTGMGVSGDGGTVQNVTLQAAQ